MPQQQSDTRIINPTATLTTHTHGRNVVPILSNAFVNFIHKITLNYYPKHE